MNSGIGGISCPLSSYPFAYLVMSWVKAVLSTMIAFFGNVRRPGWDQIHLKCSLEDRYAQ